MDVAWTCSVCTLEEALEGLWLIGAGGYRYRHVNSDEVIQIDLDDGDDAVDQFPYSVFLIFDWQFVDREILVICPVTFSTRRERPSLRPATSEALIISIDAPRQSTSSIPYTVALKYTRT